MTQTSDTPPAWSPVRCRCEENPLAEQGEQLASTGSAGDTKYLYDASGSLLLRHSRTGTTLYTGGEEITLKTGESSADGVRYISIAGQTVAIHSSDGKFTYLMDAAHNSSSTRQICTGNVIVSVQCVPSVRTSTSSMPQSQVTTAVNLSSRCEQERWAARGMPTASAAMVAVPKGSGSALVFARLRG